MHKLSKIEQFEGKVICIKCGWKWTPRTKQPAECPACKSRNWKGNNHEK